MSVTNGFGPATFPIKFGLGFTDDLPSGEQVFVYLGQIGSSSPVAGELHEPSFNCVSLSSIDLNRLLRQHSYLPRCSDQGIFVRCIYASRRSPSQSPTV
jgi:hypothetical protein